MCPSNLWDMLKLYGLSRFSRQKTSAYIKDLGDKCAHDFVFSSWVRFVFTLFCSLSCSVHKLVCVDTGFVFCFFRRIMPWLNLVLENIFHIWHQLYHGMQTQPFYDGMGVHFNSQLWAYTHCNLFYVVVWRTNAIGSANHNYIFRHFPLHNNHWLTL